MLNLLTSSPSIVGSERLHISRIKASTCLRSVAERLEELETKPAGGESIAPYGHAAGALAVGNPLYLLSLRCTCIIRVPCCVKKSLHGSRECEFGAETCAAAVYLSTLIFGATSAVSSYPKFTAEPATMPR